MICSTPTVTMIKGPGITRTAEKYVLSPSSDAEQRRNFRCTVLIKQSNLADLAGLASASDKKARAIFMAHASGHRRPTEAPAPRPSLR